MATEGQTSRPESRLGVRHLIAVLLFLASTVAYATRVTMSVAIVAMTSDNDYGYPVFDWERSKQDTILSSFFWGYIVPQIPAGMLAGRFGGKWLIFASLLSNGVINLFLPIVATKFGWIGVCLSRILMGLGQGMLYPSLHGLLGQWVPITERSRISTFVYSGAQLGTVIELMAAGALSASRWGWPSVYYMTAVICLAWSALWLVFGASAPSSSRWISSDEKKYIEMNTGSTDISDKKKLPTPWKSIWTSLPFWAILLAHSGQSLGFWTLLTEMPTYMSKVLGVNIKSNGMLSSLPYIAMYFLSLTFAWISDTLINRKIVSVTVTRKIFNTIAFWGPAAALLGLSYLPAGHLAQAVVLLTFTVGLNAGHYVGFMISHIDISPNFASTLMGITNGLANVFSIMAPLSVSLVVRDETSASEWRKVFFISIAFYFISNLFYVLFMVAKVQDWNEPQVAVALEDGIQKKESDSSKKETEDK